MTWNRTLQQIIAEDYYNSLKLNYPNKKSVVVNYEGLLKILINENLTLFYNDKIGKTRFYFKYNRKRYWS